MAELRTDYAEDKLDTSKNTIRKYNLINNDDGTTSLVDATSYLTKGTSFGAKDVNDITGMLNKALILKSFDTSTGVLNIVSVSEV